MCSWPLQGLQVGFLVLMDCGPGLQEVTPLTSLSNFVHHGMIYIPTVRLSCKSFFLHKLLRVVLLPPENTRLSLSIERVVYWAAFSDSVLSVM